jgi:hypothetical protein
METTEVLFKTKTATDRKNKLNRLSKKVNRKYLDVIEAGVTVEYIDSMIADGLPVFKYGTQITIHGMFEELNNNYIFGYKNIFQNKNNSIGIKYNAIDEAKRQRIAEYLKLIGFNYNRNSQNTVYSLIRSVNKDNFETVKTEMLQLKNKIDVSLFFGSVSVYVAQSWGQTYICIDIYINAIYEVNIMPFINKLGITEQTLIDHKAKEAKEAQVRAEQWNKEAEQRKQDRAKILEENKQDLELLSKYSRVEKSQETGLYLLRTFDYNDQLIYKVIYLYMPKGKKKLRANKKEYKSIHEALKHEPGEGYSDKIYNGRVTGYRLQ